MADKDTCPKCKKHIRDCTCKPEKTCSCKDCNCKK